MVEVIMSLLNVTVMGLLTETLLAPFEGLMDRTAGLVDAYLRCPLSLSK
jgi:hypothetical protein